MKQQNVIQRLCIFFFALALTAPAWSYSYTWAARDRGVKETEGTRTSKDGIVTVSWSKCKTGPAWFSSNRNWVMEKGSTVTITCKKGYRIRAFYISEQLKNASSLYCTSNSAYKGDGSKGIECYDAPDNSITLYASKKVEFAKYGVEYVELANVRFDKEEYNGFSFSTQFPITLLSNGHTGKHRMETDNPDVADILYSTPGSLLLKIPGKATITATFEATADRAREECSTTINVVRDKVTFSIKKEDDVLFTNGKDAATHFADFYDYVEVTRQSGRPFDYKNLQLTITSDNRAVISTPPIYSNRLGFGGTAGTATITIRQTENISYEAASLSRTFTVMRSDEQGTVLIKDFNEWKIFAHLVNDKGMTGLNARLEADITLEDWSVLVGGNENPYSGIFDGNGHSLNLKWKGHILSIAPFANVLGATIKNLHIKGRITVRMGGAAGLVWAAHGATTLSNCISSVNITARLPKTAMASGLIGYVGKDGRIAINDCKVSGTLEATNANAKKGWGGFVFSNDGICTISNSLYTGSNNAGGLSYTFAKNANLKNCYYLNACGTPQGTQVTEKQLRNGYAAKLLQAGRTDKCHWAQTLGEMPELFDASKTTEDNYVYWNPQGNRWQCETFIIRDGGYLPVGIDFFANESTFGRTLASGTIHSICTPADWYSGKAKVYTLSSVNNTVASFHEVSARADGYFKAYQPYLIIPETDLYGVTLSGNIKEEPAQPVAEEVNGVKWCATYAGMTNAEAVAANAYILQGDGKWYKVTADNGAVSILPYRAYLTLTADGPAKALAISFDDEDVTGLRAIETTDADGTVRYYDLNGRYIGTTLEGQPKGIYIGNGKKVINK